MKSFFLACFCLFMAATVQAQKSPECMKVAKEARPNSLLLDKNDLFKFHKQFDANVTFKDMKIVKTELAYYLLAAEANGPRIFAFELEHSGKKLFLNRYFLIQTCDQGGLALDTFIHSNGKITGCKLGAHTIKQIDKN